MRPLASAPRWRAWRFLLPDLESPAEESGLDIGPRGVEMVEGEPAVRQALLLLLSTVPGERVMRPAYGCELHRLVFAPNDATTAGLAIHYVRRAVERWEPRVEILHLDADPNPSHPGRLDITLEYRVKNLLAVGTLTYPLMLSGERS